MLLIRHLIWDAWNIAHIARHQVTPEELTIMPRAKSNIQERPQSRIPKFASREEEASFWDTHDITDYWDELKPVKVRFAKNLSEGITIRLDPETLAKLREIAHKQGICPTTLTRMWITGHSKRKPELGDSPQNWGLGG